MANEIAYSDFRAGLCTVPFCGGLSSKGANVGCIALGVLLLLSGISMHLAHVNSIARFTVMGVGAVELILWGVAALRTKPLTAMEPDIIAEPVAQEEELIIELETNRIDNRKMSLGVDELPQSFRVKMKARNNYVAFHLVPPVVEGYRANKSHTFYEGRDTAVAIDYQIIE